MESVKRKSNDCPIFTTRDVVFKVYRLEEEAAIGTMVMMDCRTDDVSSLTIAVMQYSIND